MSKYNSSNYESAAQKYNELQQQYTGESGSESVNTYAKEVAGENAAKAGSAAGQSALSAARSAGMTKGQSALSAGQIAANTTANAYNSAYNSAANIAQQNNTNALQSQANQVNWGKAKDDTTYQNENAWWGNLLSAAGDVAGAALSDENKKNICAKTSSERCDELIKKLRGEN